MFINLPYDSQAIRMFPQPVLADGATRLRPTLGRDVDIEDVWSEVEDVTI